MTYCAIAVDARPLALVTATCGARRQVTELCSWLTPTEGSWTQRRARDPLEHLLLGRGTGIVAAGAPERVGGVDATDVREEVTEDHLDVGMTREDIEELIRVRGGVVRELHAELGGATDRTLDVAGIDLGRGDQAADRHGTRILR